MVVLCQGITLIMVKDFITSRVLMYGNATIVSNNLWHHLLCRRHIDKHLKRWFLWFQFVRDLVAMVDEQGKKWYGSRNMKVPHPTRYPTPYGGRLVWILPGATKIICHLKDKNKIRHKKRWSQCMYMYYFLGEKLCKVDQYLWVFWNFQWIQAFLYLEQFLGLQIFSFWIIVHTCV